VAVAVQTVDGQVLDLDEVRGWATDRLSKYKLPKLLMVVDDFPRNAMGKVMKPAVRDLFDG
jgi:acyl-CoA synthetase (AMP-forming)/AMP-acid ligase II